MNIPPDEYERLTWWPASQLAPPGIPVIAEIEGGEIIKAIRHSHIPTRATDDFGYRSYPEGNPIEVIRWAHK